MVSSQSRQYEVVTALPGVLLGTMLGSIVLAWLGRGSGGSVLMAILWHGTFNYVTAAPQSDQAITAFVTTAVLVWAGIVAYIWHRQAA